VSVVPVDQIVAEGTAAVVAQAQVNATSIIRILDNSVFEAVAVDVVLIDLDIGHPTQIHINATNAVGGVGVDLVVENDNFGGDGKPPVGVELLAIDPDTATFVSPVMADHITGHDQGCTVIQAHTHPTAVFTSVFLDRVVNERDH